MTPASDPNSNNGAIAAGAADTFNNPDNKATGAIADQTQPSDTNTNNGTLAAGAADVLNNPDNQTGGAIADQTQPSDTNTNNGAIAAGASQVFNNSNDRTGGAIADVNLQPAAQANDPGTGAVANFTPTNIATTNEPTANLDPAIQAVQDVANAAVINLPVQNDDGNPAKAIDQTLQQAAENDNYRNLHSDDPVERAFNGLVTAGKIPLEILQGVANHATAVVDASQQFAQDPLGTLGYGTLGTIDSAGKAALDTAEGWAWAIQNPGTAWETTKLVGSDVLRNLEDQMNRDPSGFAMQTVINLGTLLSPTSSAGKSFTLTPTAAETALMKSLPIFNGSNIPEVIDATKSTAIIPRTAISNDGNPALIRFAGDTNDDIGRFQYHQFGKGIAEDSTATAAYKHLNDRAIKVNFDTTTRPLENGKPVLGRAFLNEGKVDVYMLNNKDVQEAIGTMVHESSHIDRNMRHIPQNTKYEEYRAFTRDALFKNNGIRPNLVERKEIWDTVNKTYDYLEEGKNPFRK